MISPQQVVIRVETKSFVFVFSQKFREKRFSLFAKKAYETFAKLFVIAKVFAKVFAKKVLQKFSFWTADPDPGAT
jgi:hypothetical protein